MPTFADLDDDFVCPYRNGCPYLEGLSTSWVFGEYQQSGFLVGEYEWQLEQLTEQLDEAHRQNKQLQAENQQLKAQLHALHRRQFKARKAPAASDSGGPSTQGKKRGAPVGHPPWQRPKPKHIDKVVSVPAPARCPKCHCAHLQPVSQPQEHVQEDIVLEPRTVAIKYVHRQGYCPVCEQNVVQPGPGELLGSYIGPAAKATAVYLRYELNVPCRKISRFFGDFFGLKFVPASAYGFERQAVRRAAPLYEDLRQKIQALPVAHADETSWRHDGQNYWVWYAGNDQLACFHLDAHRSTEAAQGLLGEKFDGVIVSDAYAFYQCLKPKDWQSCLAHLKRKADEVDQQLALLEGKARDPKARQFCQQIQDLIHRACQAHHRLAKGPWRAKAAKKKGQAFLRELRKLCKQPLGYAPAEAFRQRLAGPEQKHLFTCFRRPHVPPTNNQAERSLRPVVIMRKVIHGTRSPKGLENHSIVRSLFETARRQGKKAQQFFRELFTKDTAQAQLALYHQAAPAKPRTHLRC
jgi:transposase